jgi:hypothetical protein
MSLNKQEKWALGILGGLAVIGIFYTISKRNSTAKMATPNTTGTSGSNDIGTASGTTPNDNTNPAPPVYDYNSNPYNIPYNPYANVPYVNPAAVGCDPSIASNMTMQVYQLSGVQMRQGMRRLVAWVACGRYFKASPSGSCPVALCPIEIGYPEYLSIRNNPTLVP